MSSLIWIMIKSNKIGDINLIPLIVILMRKLNILTSS